MGYSPTPKTAEPETDSLETAPVVEEKKHKVNSRDAKLHFLMGRYNSQQGLLAHDNLAHEIRSRMNLDTAFFNLFPHIYEVDGTTETSAHAAK